MVPDLASNQTSECLVGLRLSSSPCCKRHGSMGRAQSHMRAASVQAAEQAKCKEAQLLGLLVECNRMASTSWIRLSWGGWGPHAHFSHCK